jgi:hypothetical protein
MSNKIDNNIDCSNKSLDSKTNIYYEEEKKTVSKEVKNLNFVLKNYPSVSKYSWEVAGERVYNNNT